MVGRAFFDGQPLVGTDSSKTLHQAAGPFHRYLGVLVRSQSEGESQLALRAVTGAALHHLPLLPARTCDPHDGAKSTRVRFRSAQFQRQPVVAVGGLIAEQVRRLGEDNLRLYVLDLLLDVAVGREDIQLAV